MKKIILLFVMSVLPLALSAQSVTVISMDMLQSKSFKLNAHVVDSLTNESLSFVSAYMKHRSDTLITNFALSDTDGNIVLTEVTTGDYVLTVEYLGYHKYQKSIYVRKDTDLGVIRLKPDVRALDAATVTAAGREVEFKQDTIIFNATMFKTGSNDNLAALLKRMPGIEISKEGGVTVNGKAVDRITLEGKTFFLNDKNAALNNIPASIVDKIQVVDKDSDAARISGIKDVQKERVMDVQLKEEYKKGFFGNLKLAGGAAVPGGEPNDYLVTDKGLFNSSLLASYYNEKDQVTLIGNAQNVSDGNSVTVVTFGADDVVAQETLPSGGLHTSASMGVNANTDRIKNVTTTVFAKYTEDHVDKHDFSDRMSYQTGAADLRDMEESFTTGKRRSTLMNAELKNTNGKVFSFIFTPSVTYSSIGTNSSVDGTSRLGDLLSHSSMTNTIKESTDFSTNGSLQSSFKLPGNSRRRIGLNLTAGYGKGQGSEFTDRTLDYVGQNRFTQNLSYDNFNDYKSLSTALSYSEPLSDAWILRLNVNSLFRYSRSDRAALENGAYSELYSSYSTTRYNTNKVSLFGQYSKSGTTLSLGADLDAKKNWLTATANGVETQSGKDEWAYNISPYAYLSMRSKNKLTTYSVNSSGSVSMPGTSSMTPVMRIVSPTRISLGNSYLKPYTRQYVTVNISGSTAKKSTYSAYLSGSILMNSVSNAIWYDSNSIMYSVPVNVKDPGLSLSGTVNYGGLITKDGKLRFNLAASGTAQTGSSYQSTGRREGFDTSSFDYFEFMREFWGDPSGDVFYSGGSGFMKSRTASYDLFVLPTLRLNLDNFQLRASASPSFRVAKYSIDKRADISTLNMEYAISASYQTKHDFELETGFEHTDFYGYKDMFAAPRSSWDFSVYKNVKAFTLGISVNDILNNARTQSQSFSENYSQYSFTNKLGRYALFSVKYNFGKMNAAKSAAATSASIKMAM